MRGRDRLTLSERGEEGRGGTEKKRGRADKAKLKRGQRIKMEREGWN